MFVHNEAPPASSLRDLLLSLRQTPPRLIQSPPTQPRRASVALIVRMKPPEHLVFQGHEPEGWIGGEVIPEEQFGLGLALDDFLRLSWVNHPETIPQLLFIRRSPSHTPSSSRSSSSRWSSHIAFPGGRHEASDESALYTALRETWEEIGIDLAEKEFVQAGRLDEREITTSLGKRLLMILSPFVFVQTSPFSPPPELQATEVASVHWIPLSSLTPPFSPAQWSHIEIDISTRLSPRNKFIRWALRGLVGKMEFGCVLLPDEPDHVAEGFDVNMEFIDPPDGGGGTWFNPTEGRRMLRLWGLSLGMTLDLLAHLPTASPSPVIVSKTASQNTSLGPRTPVTVTSSFDAQWDAARKDLEAKNGVSGTLPAEAGSQASSAAPSIHTSPAMSTHSTQTATAVPEMKKLPGILLHNGEGKTIDPGRSGAGLTRFGALGTKVDMRDIRKRRRGVGPGVTAVFPRFSYPDVNFWIWVFGRKYRQVVKGWEASLRGPFKASDRRMNWSGAALSTFYSAVRHALVVAILIRAIATGVGIAGLAWFLIGRYGTGTGRFGLGFGEL